MSYIAITLQKLINSLSNETNKTKRKVYVDINSNTYEVIDYYIDEYDDIVLETGDEV